MGLIATLLQISTQIHLEPQPRIKKTTSTIFSIIWKAASHQKPSQRMNLLRCLAMTFQCLIKLSKTTMVAVFLMKTISSLPLEQKRRKRKQAMIRFSKLPPRAPKARDSAKQLPRKPIITRTSLHLRQRIIWKGEILVKNQSRRKKSLISFRSTSLILTSIRRILTLIQKKWKKKFQIRFGHFTQTSSPKA